MKGGQAPIHFMRWAPSDYVNDPWVKLAASRNDVGALTVYHLFLNHSFMEGGFLPADPELLAGVLGLSAATIRKALAYWSAQECGLILIKDGRAWNPRVRRDVVAELKFRRLQSKLGKEGGKKAGRGRPLSSHRATPMATIGPPSPLPTPTPTPFPSPTPTPSPSRARPTDVDRHGSPGEGVALQAEVKRLLFAESEASGRPQDELLFEASDTGRGAITNVDGCQSVPWLKVARDKLIAMRLRREAKDRPPAPAPENPKARARQESFEAGIRGGLNARPGLDTGLQPAGGDDEGSGHDAGGGGGPRRLLPPRPRSPDR